MTTRLSWRASGSADCFYAVRRMLEGRAATTPTAIEALAEPAAGLGRVLTARSLSSEAFFDRLIPAAAEIESNRQLAQTVLTKLLGAGGGAPLVEELAGLIGDCERPYFQAFPKLMDDLALRGGPLRELWEARGPGLLAGVARRTDPRLVVEAATVNLVQPYLGGGGLSHGANNSVTLEAVLADRRPQLPETVRLAWLVSSLNADLPEFVDLLSPGKAATVVSLAMLPAVLEAAGDVEWVKPNAGDELLTAAAAAWEIPQPAGERTAEIVAGWWQFTRERNPPWNIALTGLERLLFEGEKE